MAQRIGENLYRENGTIYCVHCNKALCPASENPKEACLQIEREVGDANPWIALRFQGKSERFKLVEYACPSCHTLIDVVQMPRGQARPWHDYQVY